MGSYLNYHKHGCITLIKHVIVHKLKFYYVAKANQIDFIDLFHSLYILPCSAVDNDCVLYITRTPVSKKKKRRRRRRRRRKSKT